MDGVDQLDGAAGILTSDVNARPVVVVGKELRKDQARVVMRVEIFRPDRQAWGLSGSRSDGVGACTSLPVVRGCRIASDLGTPPS